MLIETVDIREGDMKLRSELLSMGYKSNGVFTLKTSGTLEQLSGAKLQRSWFGLGNSYSVPWGVFDEPIKVRLKW